MGRIGLAVALAATTACENSPNPEGWVGNDVSEIADSSFVKKYGYADCPATAGEVWEKDTTDLDCLPLFDEKPGEKHLLPNPGKVQLALARYPDVASVIDTAASYSSLTLTTNGKKIAQTISLFIHPTVEQIADGNDKTAYKKRVEIVEEFIEEATGVEKLGSVALALYQAANNCGSHAPNQTGRTYKKEIEEFTVSIVASGEPNPQHPPVAQALEGDCAVTISFSKKNAK
jgi:hypothetical protein